MLNYSKFYTYLCRVATMENDTIKKYIARDILDKHDTIKYVADLFQWGSITYNFLGDSFNYEEFAQTFDTEIEQIKIQNSEFWDTNNNINCCKYLYLQTVDNLYRDCMLGVD